MFLMLDGRQLHRALSKHQARRENGTILPAEEAIYAASASQFSQAPRDEQQ
jgi:hypothetical protein